MAAKIQGELMTTQTGRILVVDDHPTNRLKLSMAVKKLGHEAEAAENGKRALEMLRTGSFDLVLLDLLMPEMDGHAVLGAIKDDAALRSVPVIIISSVDEMDSIVKAIQLGADDYLPKDFNPVLLEARVSSSLEKKRLHERELAVLEEHKRAEEALRQAAEQAQANLARYFSPNLAKQLADDPTSLDLSGERRELSFLFTDLADFTPLVEKLEPALIISMLNEYLDGITRIVFEHQGTVDKVVGDAVHSMFGAPLEQPDHAERAVRCAMAIDAFCEAFRQRQITAGIPLGVTRIGVHTGPAIVGNFGGELYFDYTAHGDVINTTARLESANKPLGTRICVSSDAVAHIPDFSGRPVGALMLKGRSSGLRVYQPLTPSEAEAPANQAYREAFGLLESGDPKAGQAFAAVVGNYGEDPLATFHLKRALAGESGVTIQLGST